MAQRNDDTENTATAEERERTVELLRAASDKLDFDELDRRLDAAVGARTRGQLAILTWDLAHLPTRPPPPRRRIWQSPGFRMHAWAYGLTNGFLVGTWALAGAGFFWPFFPAAGWGIGLGLHAAAASSVQHHLHQRELKRHHSPIPARMAPPAQIMPAAAQETASHSVVVMFSDVVDSTALTRAIGDDEWIRVRARHVSLLRSCYEVHQGEEVSSKGDGFLARFSSPTEAVRCAIEIQRRLRAQRDGDGFALKVRIGLHSGEAVVDSGDVLGTVVNLAARVMSEAAPEEVMVTETLADQLDARFEFEDRGLRSLKGFTQPRHLLAVTW